MRSLTWKLVLAFALVTLLAVTGVGILARRAAITELSTYVTQAGAARAEEYAPLFARYYADTGSWDGVEDALATVTNSLTPGRGMMGMGMGGPRGQSGAMQTMGSSQYEIIVADAQGAIVAHYGRPQRSRTNAEHGGTGRRRPH